MTEDLFRFYEDLGIIANRGTAMENNDNLLQGQQYMEHRRYNKRHVKPHMVEGFTAGVPANANANANANATPASAPAGASINSSKVSNLMTTPINNNEINLDATTFQPINNSSKTIEGRKINSVLETRSIKYHYIAWAFFAVFIIWAIFNISTFSFSGINFSSEFQPAQNESNMFSMVIMLILIVIVFVVFRQFNSSQVKTTVRVYDNSKNDNGNGNGDSKSKNDNDKSKK